MEWKKKGSGKHYKIKGIHTYPPQIVSANKMEVDLHKGDIEWVVELHILEAAGKGALVHLDVQSILDRYPTIFGDIPLGRPPD